MCIIKYESAHYTLDLPLQKAIILVQAKATMYISKPLIPKLSWLDTPLIKSILWRQTANRTTDWCIIFRLKYPIHDSNAAQASSASILRYSATFDTSNWGGGGWGVSWFWERARMCGETMGSCDMNIWYAKLYNIAGIESKLNVHRFKKQLQLLNENAGSQEQQAKDFSGIHFSAVHKLRLHQVLVFGVRWQLFYGTLEQLQMQEPGQQIIYDAISITAFLIDQVSN